MNSVLKKVFTISWEIVESLTFGLGIFVVVYAFFFQVQEVHGMSSYPTVKPGEKIVVDKISYKLSSPQRGDFIVLKSPENPEVDIIKRIVGLPGERLKINDGDVYINKEVLKEEYLTKDIETGPENFLNENEEIIIPENYYFVMGDNRSASSDSRQFGPIKSNLIIGKVIVKFWPPESIGFVKN